MSGFNNDAYRSQSGHIKSAYTIPIEIKILKHICLPKISFHIKNWIIANKNIVMDATDSISSTIIFDNPSICRKVATIATPGKYTLTSEGIIASF